jgi:hypothetical protein
MTYVVGRMLGIGMIVSTVVLLFKGNTSLVLPALLASGVALFAVGEASRYYARARDAIERGKG